MKKKFLATLLATVMIFGMSIPSVEARTIGKAAYPGGHTFDQRWSVVYVVNYEGTIVGSFWYGYDKSNNNDYAKSYSNSFDFGASVKNGQGRSSINLKGKKSSGNDVMVTIGHNGTEKIEYKFMLIDVPNDYLPSHLSFTGSRSANTDAMPETWLKELESVSAEQQMDDSAEESLK